MIAWSILKIAFMLFLCLAFVVFVKVIVNPYFTRQRYRKYKNVVQSNHSHYLLGDIYEMEENIANNRFIYWHYVELATKDTQPDIYLKFNGWTPLFLMFSTKAVREFSKQYLTKIDRNDYMLNRTIGKMFYNSFATKKSDENFKGRRDTIMKTLGINFSSRFIHLNNY